MGKKEDIIELVKKDKRGLTVADISRELKIARNTISIVLAELTGAELVEVRNVGIAKLYYWRGK